MDSYIARQATVTAVQWTGSNAGEVAELLRVAPGDTAMGIAAEMARQDGRLRATYLGKPLAADPGDWYVRDQASHVTVMPASEFEAAYQPVTGSGLLASPDAREIVR